MHELRYILDILFHSITNLLTILLNVISTQAIAVITFEY